MFELFFKDDREIRKPSRKYLIFQQDGCGCEADDMRDLAAAVCGEEYYECDFAETRWQMRVSAAKPLALGAMAMESIALGMSDEEFDETENLIVYDERIGKIPYSYTDPVVDYDIHGDPMPIRVECDETFIYSLAKANLIAVFEKSGNAYKNILEIHDVDALIDKALEPFRLITERAPLHKKFGE
jgi:hypothetical protein